MPHDSSPSWIRPARNVLISAFTKPTSGWVLSGFGLLGGAMNAFMLVLRLKGRNV